ncbi:hypothetical protein [Propionispora sp. 2/2-37]|uniref:glycoside hydrolase family 78 protein n=1 Tax=Propionispora sp. 2/2-37 TaxID=1677858 RepID=UPI0012E131F8|nr:hypothetical protein [Propionispora sp. 2/2-37]
MEEGYFGFKQKAYQIIAAEGLAELENGQLKWDSGKVASDECIHIPYGGQELKSRQRIYWKVRIWNEKQK